MKANLYFGVYSIVNLAAFSFGVFVKDFHPASFLLMMFLDLVNYAYWNEIIKK